MENSYFLTNLSVLYRNTQKYFDKMLAKYDIGSGQLIFLFYINEHEGATMQDVTTFSEVDKGTTTKSIQRLIEQGYVQQQKDESDGRVKRLYTTSKAAEIMNSLYEYRNDCRSKLAMDTDFDIFEQLLTKICRNSRMYLVPEERFGSIKIGGLQKLTLLDYPGKTAATIFTSGCNFKCPYCHNKDLVFVPENYAFIDPDEVLEFLEKRKGVLDAVCISGGEPLIHEDLISFIEEIKKIGYLVKLDTNGNYPDRLKNICETGLIDYVAMDLKNSKEKYASTVGMNADVFQWKNIEESIQFLQASGIEHEFRTTVIRELHTLDDLKEIASWIPEAKHYYLQQYVDSGNVIQPIYTAYRKDEMQEIYEEIKQIVPSVELRGIKEG